MRPIAARTADASASARPAAGRTSRIDVVHDVLRDRNVDLEQVLGLVGPPLHLPRDADDFSHAPAATAARVDPATPHADRRSALQVATHEGFVDDADRHAAARYRVR